MRRSDGRAGAADKPTKLRTALPCQYIFPPNRAAHMQWPMHTEPTPQSKRVGFIVLNMRFLVVEIRGNWARLQLTNGLEGWSPMSSRGKFYLCPYHHELHHNLKPVRNVPQRKRQPRQPPPARLQKTRPENMSVMELLFGTYNESAPQPRPRPRGKPGRGPGKRASPHGRAGAGAGASRPAVYNWQRQRGQIDGYASVLEARREELRGCDLSTNTMALQEWIELIKELDVVLRFKFRSKIEPHTDVRKPRSSSFLVSPRQQSPASRPAAEVDATPVRRQRSNSFAYSSPGTGQSQQHTPPPWALKTTATTGAAEAAAPHSTARGPAAKLCPHGQEQATCTFGNCAMGRRGSEAAAAWAAAASPPPTAETATLPFPVVTGPKPVPTAPTSTTAGAKCKHGGDPSVCTYGSCVEGRAGATSVAAKCQHGTTPSSCPHSSCSRPATKSTKKCKHGNAPESCRYGDCPLMEKMVQEEIARLKASARPPPVASAPDVAPAVKPAMDVTSGPAIKPAAVTAPKVTKAAEPKSGPEPVAAAAAPATAAAVPATPTKQPTTQAGLTLTGGKRVMVKKVKKRAPASSKPVRKLVKRTGNEVTPSKEPAPSAPVQKPTAPKPAPQVGGELDEAEDSPKSRRALFSPPTTDAAPVANDAMSAWL